MAAVLLFANVLPEWAALSLVGEGGRGGGIVSRLSVTRTRCTGQGGLALPAVTPSRCSRKLRAVWKGRGEVAQS